MGTDRGTWPLLVWPGREADRWAGKRERNFGLSLYLASELLPVPPLGKVAQPV